MSEKYKELLKDPLWIDKSKEIKHLDEYECIDCGLKYVGDKDKLDVHHTYYTKGKLAWEYNPSDMMVLCRDYHKEIHNII